ncbi:MAG: class I SAM-dependent methyltransferase [Rhodospirillales bacterium]|nr:class I SAM-dependent methyltransferase [Rhodospirillales bacterium]
MSQAIHPVPEPSHKATARCESCGGTALRVVLRDEIWTYSGARGPAEYRYDFLGCAGCGLGFVYPKPDAETIASLYEDYSFYAFDPEAPRREAASLKYRLARARHAALARPTAAARFGAFVPALFEWASGRIFTFTLGLPPNLSKAARIMDVGFGRGAWLLTMKELGYTDLAGYDIDANNARANALREAGVAIYCGPFVDGDFDGRPFDLIRLEHVFEHLADPAAVLGRIYTLLKPGGWLVMNYPAHHNPLFAQFPRAWGHADFPRHLYLHSRRSTRRYLEQAGFAIAGLRLYGDPLALAQTVNIGLLGAKNRIPRPVFAALAPLYALFCRVAGAGDLITVAAHKPAA